MNKFKILSKKKKKYIYIYISVSLNTFNYSRALQLPTIYHFINISLTFIQENKTFVIMMKLADDSSSLKSQNMVSRHAQNLDFDLFKTIPFYQYMYVSRMYYNQLFSST